MIYRIYRENGRRYIPIKFSVQGHDLASTMTDVQTRLARQVRMPQTYHYEWAGEYDSLTRETRRLEIVVPLNLAVILVLLYIALGSWADAAVILAALPFGIVGGVLSLFVTRTPFSISAAVGFASVFGVATLGGLVFLHGIRHAQKHAAERTEGIRAGALGEIRPVTMAFLAAALGLLPAAVSSGIGAQAQQPLARVVVGGMLTTSVAIPFLIPVLASLLKPGHSARGRGQA